MITPFSTRIWPVKTFRRLACRANTIRVSFLFVRHAIAREYESNRKLIDIKRRKLAGGHRHTKVRKLREKVKQSGGSGLAAAAQHGRVDVGPCGHYQHDQRRWQSITAHVQCAQTQLGYEHVL